MQQPLQIWRIPLQADEQHQARMHRLLDDAECHRAAQFRHAADRCRYVLSHGAMREILSGMTGIAPDALPLSTGPQGKPFLHGSHTAVQFNLSHSQDMALLAVMSHPSVLVGVDIEWQRPLRGSDGDDLPNMIDQVCSAGEKQIILASANPEQLFYQCWVAKEAVLKCMGTGLSRPMPEFGLLNADDMQDGDAVWSVLSLPMEAGSPFAVSFQLLHGMPAGFAAAVAVGTRATTPALSWPIQWQTWIF